jgi:hydroxymethylglutaryl-CoA reductase
MGVKSNVVVGNGHFLKVMLEFLVQSVIDLDIGLVYTNMCNTQVDSIFIATGEGRTQNVETTQCIPRLAVVNDGKDLHIAMTMPVIQVGTIAGMVESVA